MCVFRVCVNILYSRFNMPCFMLENGILTGLLIVCGVLFGEILVVVFLTPRLVFRWIKAHFGELVSELITSQEGQEVIEDLLKKVMVRIWGSLGGRPQKPQSMLQNLILQFGQGFLEKKGLIPKDIQQAAQVINEAQK